MNTFVNMTNVRLSSGDEADEHICNLDEVKLFRVLVQFRFARTFTGFFGLKNPDKPLRIANMCPLNNPELFLKR
jgi:hypothetical protein